MNTPFILWHPEPVLIFGCHLIRKKVMRLTKHKPPSASLAFLPITIHSIKCTLIDRNLQNLQLKSSVVMVSNPLWTCTNYHEPLRGVSLSKVVATSKPPRFLFCMDILAARLSQGKRIILFSDWLWRICGTAQCVTTPNVR